MSAMWPYLPLKRVADVRGGITKGRDLTGKDVRSWPYLRVANVQDGHIDMADMAEIMATEAEARRCRLQPGDVLMNEGGDADKLGRGAMWDGQVDPCLHQNHVFCVRPSRAIHPPWLSYVIGSAPAKYYFESKAKQTTGIASISSTNLKELPVPLPALPTQKAIADFLDRKTACLDALIEKKRKLLDLLAEKRAALINQAVTKGLDPTVPMKDSGIPWIGEIPAHWEVSRLSFRYSQQLGKMLNPSATAGHDQAPYLGNKDVQWDHVRVDALSTMSFSPTERVKFSLREGDLLVCEGGETGRTAVWRSELPVCYFQKAIHRLRPNDPERDHPRFFYYSMFAAKTAGAFEEIGNKATIGHLTGETLRAHRFPWPPAMEQVAIAGYLDTQASHVRRLSAAVQRQLERLQEYRQALITAAVTGQMEVAA